MIHRPQQTIKKDQQQGFSFIELMVAIAILSIGVMAVVAMQAASAKGNRKAGDMNEALYLAGQELERLMAIPYADLTDTAKTPSPDSRVTGAGNSVTLSWTITEAAAASPEANSATIVVTANYKAAGENRTLSLTGVKPNLNL